MFVRWKKRYRDYPGSSAWKREQRQKSDGTYSLDAVLVESYRQDGKVKQRFIKHLGTVANEHQPFRCELFWRDVSKNLDAMGLDSEERKKIETKINEKISRPTEAQVDEEISRASKELKELESIIARNRG